MCSKLVQWGCILLLFLLITACNNDPSNLTSTSDPSFSLLRLVPHKSDSQTTDNLWVVLGKSFNLPDESWDVPQVNAQINWYLEHPAYLREAANNAAPYLYYIYQQVNARNLPTELVLLPIVESAYDPFVSSGVGAAGIWQMMPTTASGFGLKVDWWYDGRRDIAASTDAALNYLSYLGSFFDNNWLLAIAAYDSGEGTVEAAMRANADKGENTDFWDLQLSMETRSYVPKILALATILRYPDRYPINLTPIPNAPYLIQVPLKRQIDLNTAAELAGISLTEFTSLNPGYSRWATDPHGSHNLLLPIDKAQLFQERLASLSTVSQVSSQSELAVNENTPLKYYMVKKGETLASIAEKYHVTIAHLQSWNGLHNDSILYPGTQLVVSPGNDLRSSSVSLSPHKALGPHKIYYTVKAGDTLSKIADRYGVSIEELQHWNQISTHQALHPRQRLIIYLPHT